MKHTLLALVGFILLSTPLAGNAQFNYTTNNGTITITGYYGPGGAVTIPDTITGHPVTRIGESAFDSKTTLTSVTIPNSVTSIGNTAFAYCTSLTSVTIPNSVISLGAAFYFCTSLTNVTIGNGVTGISDSAFASCTSLMAITVDALNSAYSSVDGVLFNKSQTLLIVYPGGKAGSYTIPNSVTSIGEIAFYSCTSLTSVNIPHSVTNIGFLAFYVCTNLTNVSIGSGVISIEGRAFYGCTSLITVTIPKSVMSIGGGAFDYCLSLAGVYFQGNAPGTDGGWVFDNANDVTVYYLPGTMGWGTTFAYRPAVLWNPLVATGNASFGVRTNRFGFTIIGTADIPIVVEACTSLANASWVPLQSLNLTNGAFYFSDPNWTNFPARNYRIRSP